MMQQQSEPYDAVSEKSTLSPWVPLPDAVARKALDMVQANGEDRHVDLGCGDGRVNFHAVDGFGVQSSIGIEVDEALVQAANDRLRKRHPLPTNIEFRTADLLADVEHDSKHSSVWWEIIPSATIITFYFAKPEMIRSRLELALTGKRCKVVSCGYQVPGWESTMEEVVLGTRIYVYEFGGDNPSMFRGEDLVSHLPPEATAAASVPQQHNKFSGANVVDRTGQFPIQGFNPDAMMEVDDIDEDWDAQNEAEDEAKATAEPSTSSDHNDDNETTPKRGCGKKK